MNQLMHPRSGSAKCPAGVEPARPPWRGGRQPLRHGHICKHRRVKERGAANPPGDVSPGGSRPGRSRTSAWRLSAACFSAKPRAEQGFGECGLMLKIANPASHESGWPDSNRRSLAPKAGGLPGFPTSRATKKARQSRDAGPEPTIRLLQPGSPQQTTATVQIRRTDAAIIRLRTDAIVGGPSGQHHVLPSLVFRADPAGPRSGRHRVAHAPIDAGAGTRFAAICTFLATVASGPDGQLKPSRPAKRPVARVAGRGLAEPGLLGSILIR